MDNKNLRYEERPTVATAGRVKNVPGAPARVATGKSEVMDESPDGHRLRGAGVCLLLAAVALAPVMGGTPPGSSYGADPSLGALRILVLLAALCVGIAWPLTSVPASGAGRVARAGVWALFGWTLVSLLAHSRFFTSPVLLFAMLPTTLTWFCYAMVFTLAFALTRDRRGLTLLAGTLVAGAAWVALVGAREYGAQALAGNRSWRTVGTFWHSNFTAGFLALCLPLAVVGFLRARSRVGALGWGAFAVLMTGVLVTTGSRAGLLAAGAGLLSAFVLALLARVRLPWPRLAILLIAALVLAFAFRGSILGRLGQNIDRRTGVDVYRAWTWKGTFAMARANPLFGTGPGTFEARYGRYARIAPTTHAHSSYLQVAAEQGFPALAAAVAALALALVSGLRGLRPLPPGGTTDAEQERRFVFCALFGGLVAGVIRAAFDSEWWVLGNGIPFWTVAGLVAGGAVRPAKAQTGDSATAKRLFWPARVAALAAIAGTCALSLMLFFHAVALQGARIAVQEDPATALPRAQIVAQTWPPDPEALALFGSLLDPARALPLYEQAARIEPSGSRLFPLAGVYGVLGRSREALQTLEQARNAQPTVLQNLRALAEAYERQNSHDRALATWNELARLQEGPVGQVIGTAIFPETEAAWAYAALAREALVRGNIQAAADLYGKSAAQIEDYSATSPEGQLAELVMAQSSGEDVSKKRREIRALYEQVMDAQIALETKRRNPVQVQRLEKRKAETLARLASFATDKDLATGQ